MCLDETGIDSVFQLLNTYGSVAIRIEGLPNSVRTEIIVIRERTGHQRDLQNVRENDSFEIYGCEEMNRRPELEIAKISRVRGPTSMIEDEFEGGGGRFEGGGGFGIVG